MGFVGVTAGISHLGLALPMVTVVTHVFSIVLPVSVRTTENLASFASVGRILKAVLAIRIALDCQGFLVFFLAFLYIMSLFLLGHLVDQIFDLF